MVGGEITLHFPILLPLPNSKEIKREAIQSVHIYLVTVAVVTSAFLISTIYRTTFWIKIIRREREVVILVVDYQHSAVHFSSQWHFVEHMARTKHPAARKPSRRQPSGTDPSLSSLHFLIFQNPKSLTLLFLSLKSKLLEQTHQLPVDRLRYSLSPPYMFFFCLYAPLFYLIFACMYIRYLFRICLIFKTFLYSLKSIYLSCLLKEYILLCYIYLSCLPDTYKKIYEEFSFEWVTSSICYVVFVIIFFFFLYLFDSTRYLFRWYEVCLIWERVEH